MKKIRRFILAAGLLIFNAACENNFLDRLPLDQISTEVFFRTTSELELYMNQFYKPHVLDYGGAGGLNYSRLIFNADANSDNFITTNVSTLLNGTRVVPASGGGWDYSNVRAINYFFDNYRKCKDPFENYRHYVGEAHFFRAMIYFQLVQLFGDVVWYNKTLATNSPELYAPRTPRNVVVDNIIADLDTAALYLSPTRREGGTRLDKWSALALQSRVALYEGTWEKYHDGTAFGVPSADPAKYLNKAVEAAGALIGSGAFGIYNTGNPESDYYNFFNLHDYAANKEVILWKKFDKDLGIVNYRMISGRYPSGTGITKSLADAFLCKDGLPVSTSPLFKGYGSIYDEMKDRDPRYRQTIFTPDAPYMTGPGTSIDWNEGVFSRLFANSEFSTATGYVPRKGYNHDLSTHDLAGEDEPIILFSYAEVLLNYAEAKAELGTLTQADLDLSIKPLRDRAGMPPITLGRIAADPAWEFPQLSPLLNEIRRERRIELSLVGFRWDDIARWAAADELIAGKRPKGIRYGNQFPKNPYPNDAEGFMDPYKAAIPSGFGFRTDRDYLAPLPQSELTLNTALKQNPGW